MQEHPSNPRRTFGAECRNLNRPGRGRGALLRLGRDQRGVATIAMAVATASLLGVAGLAVAGGGWYLLRRNMQAAEDAASLAR